MLLGALFFFYFKSTIKEKSKKNLSCRKCFFICILKPPHLKLSKGLEANCILSTAFARHRDSFKSDKIDGKFAIKMCNSIQIASEVERR